jgi:uncharacterized protein
VTGAGGLIGGALLRALRSAGDDAIVIPRDAASVPAADAVVHLAGAPIAVRWTAQRKHAIVESRVLGTRRLVEMMRRCQAPPRVFVCASAIGYYGDRGEEALTESSAPGADFLARLVRDWEAAAGAAASGAGTRAVQLRFGLVLSPHGGALAKMLPVFRIGAGGPLGSGKQWMSWISLDDVVRVIRFVVEAGDVSGPVNAVAPEPVTNADFTSTLGRVLRRPAVLPVPAFALRALFGEMASLTMLASQRVRPVRLEKAGFQFQFPSLEGALRHELGIRDR